MSNIKNIINTIPNNVTLVAATKYVDSAKMKELFDNGINNFVTWQLYEQKYLKGE